MARGEVGGGAGGGAGGGVRGALWGDSGMRTRSMNSTRCILINVGIVFNKSAAIQFSVVADWAERPR
jgi:hypothetical protein